MIAKIVIFIIYSWHYFLSKFLAAFTGQPVSCRFYPSCSVYTAQAVKKLGPAKGIKLGILRILKCHPLGKARAEFLT